MIRILNVLAIAALVGAALYAYSIAYQTIFSAEEISDRLQALAAEIASKRPQNLLVVPILKGSFVFAADLLRALYAAGLAPEVDFLTLSSYRKSRISSNRSGTKWRRMLCIAASTCSTTARSGAWC